ncbi:MAG: PAN domain-containing protein [Methanothrix sp.]|nr:PAN domain-containing protein [Methanothrix sp.]
MISFAWALENNIDRPGMDYQNFDLTSANPSLCENACKADPNCKSFTYVKPGYQGPNARCWLKNGVPNAVSAECCISGKIATPSAPVGMENNIDRPGMDYKDFDLSSANPNLCEKACADDPNCKAFTYVRPGYQGAMARCWLKSGVPDIAVPAECCISGKKAGTIPSIPAGLENNVDRPGMDYKDFDLSSANPNLCEKACADDPNCKAFTYVRPGYQGAMARCWLKSGVPDIAVPAECCISGKKVGGSVPSTGSIENNIDRPGMDYKDFDLTSANPSLCENACNADPNCKSFTYVKPGYQGASARCWLKSGVPNAVPAECCMSGKKVGGSTPTSGGIENNIDRPGMDYQNFDLSSANPSLCENACNADPNCKSFTYVKPGYQGANARCWLKNGVPNAVPAECCMSGKKVGASTPTTGSIENNIDRPGMDYQNFDLSSANPSLCENACNADPNCKAFTYVRPGYQGANARCWLKSGVPDAVSNSCCISGAK